MSEKTVYAIASGKGGVGKTTTTVNLGAAIAQTGERVVVVDTDLGMANLSGFVSLDAESTTLHDVLADEAPLPAATYQLTESLAAIPSGTGLSEYAKTEPEGLGDVVSQLRESFDVVLLDVGAGVSHETVLPLGLADSVLLVSTPEPASVHDTRKTLELTERTGGEVAGLVITRTRPSSDISYEEIATQLDVPLVGTVPDDTAVRESVYAGTPLVVYDPERPAAVAYTHIAGELRGVAERDDETSETEAVREADGNGDEGGEAVTETITEAESNR
ncbi:cell division ATPase MinD [Halobacteria archaeon AArc-dxtr1]|nr:cell division ATPase MinD [Halobacteria archaeon AArc-dxtr1]